jgi:hypothetical protein
MVRAFIESLEYRQRFGGAPGGNQQGAVEGAELKGKNWRDALARAAPFLFDPALARLWLPG